MACTVHGFTKSKTRLTRLDDMITFITLSCVYEVERTKLGLFNLTKKKKKITVCQWVLYKTSQLPDTRVGRCEKTGYPWSGAGKEKEKEHLRWEGNICLNERGQKRGLRSMTVQRFLQDGIVCVCGWGGGVLSVFAFHRACLAHLPPQILGPNYSWLQQKRRIFKGSCPIFKIFQNHFPPKLKLIGRTKFKATPNTTSYVY